MIGGSETSGYDMCDILLLCTYLDVLKQPCALVKIIMLRESF